MTAEIEVYLEDGGTQVDAQLESFRGPQGIQGEPGRALRDYALNGDFAHFVAQAGICAAHCGGTTVFAGDGWELAEGTFTAEERADGLGYSSACLNGTLRQRLEEKPSGAGFAGVRVSGGEAAAHYDAESGILEVIGAQAVLERVWLCEEETLTPPGARAYPEELALCQRRYQVFPAVGEISIVGYAFNDKTARFTLSLPVPMRLSSPTLQVSYRTNVVIYPSGEMPSAIGGARAEGTLCALVMYGTGFASGEVLVCKPNAKIELCCDLL